jgi:hypothetical protein
MWRACCSRLPADESELSSELVERDTRIDTGALALVDLADGVVVLAAEAVAESLHRAST